MHKKSQIGLVGLSVMGANLALNIAENEFDISVYNRTPSKTEDLWDQLQTPHYHLLKNKTHPFFSLKDLILSLETPRKLIFMIQSGEAIDLMIEQCLEFMVPGDIIIDGGNSHFSDTVRRLNYLNTKGLYFIGMGISGGEEGARHGPSLMAGGNHKAWPFVKDIFTKISAKTKEGEHCCAWMGNGGAGHYVKMVHNAIEYCDMQLIAEVYDIFRKVYQLDNDEISDIFSEWNHGQLSSYLIEISSIILRKKENDQFIVDNILDVARQKGTGKWTSLDILDRNVPANLMIEAVLARCISTCLDERKKMKTILQGPQLVPFEFSSEKQTILEKALLVAKILAYAQGFILLQKTSQEEKWQLNYSDIALVWRAGCIIRSDFLDKISLAYQKKDNQQHFIYDSYFYTCLNNHHHSLRQAVKIAISSGIPTPSLSAALSFYDAYRSDDLPTNLIQAQRDFFGAHLYQKKDHPEGELFHTIWD